MSRPDRSDLLLKRTCGIVLGVTTVAALYLARDVFMPLMLAILLTFLLSSSVTRLERLGVHRIGAVIGVSTLVAGAIFLIGMIVSRQLVGFAEELPSYRQNIAAKVRSVNDWAGGGVKQVFGWIDDMKALSGDPQGTKKRLRDEAEKIVDVAQSNGETKLDPATAERNVGDERKPVEVEVVNGGFQPWQLAGEWLGPLLSPLSLIGLVALFTVFMLIERNDLRNRLVILLGDQRLFATTQILDEAADKVSRYLRAQLLINVIHGTTVAVGLSIIGLPNAILWGFLAQCYDFCRIWDRCWPPSCRYAFRWPSLKAGCSRWRSCRCMW
ncbi:MAG: AI-2E family transporter [Pirellulales bacterium]